jgi:hypothetical protein
VRKAQKRISQRIDAPTGKKAQSRRSGPHRLRRGMQHAKTLAGDDG